MYVCPISGLFVLKDAKGHVIVSTPDLFRGNDAGNGRRNGCTVTIASEVNGINPLLAQLCQAFLSAGPNASLQINPLSQAIARAWPEDREGNYDLSESIIETGISSWVQNAHWLELVSGETTISVEQLLQGCPVSIENNAALIQWLQDGHLSEVLDSYTLVVQSGKIQLVPVNR